MNTIFDRVFIFGGTGSLGQSIIRFWSPKVSQFIVFGRDENKHWKLAQMFPGVGVISEIGDIADLTIVRKALIKHNPTLIIVASAMKHIDRCEQYPQRCWDTNVRGFQNILDTVRENTCPALTKIVYVSTDKACAPVNIYGMSKSTAEHMVRNESVAGFRTPIVAVRYGNVLASSGSIIPIFQSQAHDSTVHEFTLTTPDMTRFCITLEQSVKLIEDVILTGASGEIYIPIIPAMRIKDLAHLFSEKYNKPVKVVGMRVGEKIHELMYSPLEKPYISKRSIHYKKGITGGSSSTDNETRERYVLGPNIVLNPPNINEEYSSSSLLLDVSELKQVVNQWL
jgi:UDP-N-acetylglucosamine 4,6-dehydratase/5-epimerase